VGTNSNRINATVSNAVVLKNQNVGTNWNISGSLERTYRNGLYIKGGYRYGRAWTPWTRARCLRLLEQQPARGQSEQPGRGLFGVLPGHDLRAARTRSNAGRWPRGVGGLRRLHNARPAYTFSGDANGDGGTSNDLLYIPRDQSEMNFQATRRAPDFSSAEQAAAWRRTFSRMST